MRLSVVLLCGLGFLLTFQSSGTAASKPAKSLPDKGDFLILTEGIVGGFVPAHVRRQILIRSNGDGYDVFIMTQEKRTSPRTYRQGRISSKELGALFARLMKAGLWKLPTEKPTGSEDIYKLDTSITANFGSYYWRNGGPAGCVHGQSKTKANEAQRKSFRDAVATVKKFAAANAKKTGDQKSYLAALKSLQSVSRKVKGKS